VIARIRKQCESLKASPFLGRPRTEFGVELRSVPVKPFVVFYRVRDSGSIIEVVRIVDGRRDLQTVFAE
jgi:plasmid stabilization system protein ParE